MNPIFLNRSALNQNLSSTWPAVGAQLKRGLLIMLLALGSAAPAWAADKPDLASMQQFIQLMDGYYDIIDAVETISADPDKAAILQLQKIEEIYKNRGDRAEAINVMRDVLNKANSQTVRNATAVMLADALNETGKASEAIAVLREALDANLR